MSLCTKYKGRDHERQTRDCPGLPFSLLIQLKSVLFLIYGNHWFYMLSA
jgi:hypothetical protein